MSGLERFEAGGAAPAVYALTPTDSRGDALVEEILQPYIDRMTAILRRELPSWVRWLATDADGQAWAYAERPQLLVDDRCWAPFSPRAQMQLVCRQEPCLDWRTSLLQLPDGPKPAPRRVAVVCVACAAAIACGLGIVGVLAGWW